MYDLRKYLDIINESEHGSLIYRWVDIKATKSYIRHNKIVGRTRHWLPKELTGYDKFYRKIGISFSEKPKIWNAHGDDGICFVLKRNKIPNKMVDLNGQAIYIFSQEIDAFRMGVTDATWAKELKNRAIEASKKEPDEVFVIGNIENLAIKIDHILIRNESHALSLKEYCAKHDIRVQIW